jgi:signal transduction histidine kinase
MLRPTLPLIVDLEAQLTNEPLSVQADETQLQQVVMNLCLNARDAIQTHLAADPTRQQGRILVRTEAVCNRGENGSAQKHWVRLLVEDNGPGMTDQVRARIFDPFFSTKEHGTGLGLAVVLQIVEGCGGRVEVSTQPGAGARFEVWLPLLGEASNP